MTARMSATEGNELPRNSRTLKGSLRMVILSVELKRKEIRLAVDRRLALTRLATAVLFMSLITSCNDENPAGAGSDIVFPSTNVSYAQHVQPLFNQTCALSGCHDDGPHQSQLRLTSHFQTTFGLPGIVVAGQPESSQLVYRIEGTVGDRMPLNGAPLNQNQINGIRTWIAEGAQDN